MKKLLLTLSLLPLVTFSQNIKYSFSQEFESVSKHRDFGFYKLDENKYAEVYYREGDDMIFQTYDQKFNSIKSEQTVLLPEDSKRYTHESFLNLKNDYYWFYSTWTRKEKTERLFALPFDRKTLKFSNSAVELLDASKLANPSDKYRFNTSSDSTKLLITYRLKPRVRKDKLNKDLIGFNLYDNTLKKLYEAEIEMPYSEADMDIIDHEVDSKNNIYLLARVKVNNSIDGEADKENKHATRYELMRVNQKDNSMQAIKIDLGNKSTNSVLLTEDLNHNVIMTGYYSNKKVAYSSDGAYIIKLELNENNSVKNLNTTFCEFPTEILKAYESERVQKKMDKKDKGGDLEAANLSFDKIVFEKDGSMLIIGEQYHVVTYTYKCGNSYCTSYTYYYDDIIVLKADKNGKTLWCSKIPKRQMGSGSADLSYHFHQFNGEYYFFYLDNIKNLNLSLTELPNVHQSGRGGYLTSVKIDATGKMTKKSIFDIKDEKIHLFPRSFESINENLIVDRLREDRKHSKVFKIEIQ